MLMPAIARLKGTARITVVGRSPGIDFLRPHVAQCMDFERMGWHRLFMDIPEADHAMLVFQVDPMDMVVAFSADPGNGFEKNLRSHFPDSVVHVFPPFPRKGEETHVALYLARCLQSSGLPVDASACIEEAGKRSVLASGSYGERGSRVILHPGSGSARKNHPPEFWLTLHNALRETRDPHLENHCLLLGPAEKDTLPLFQEQPVDPSLQIIVTPPNDVLTSLLAQAALCIAHDSGIAHLAAMLGTPTIALFIQPSVARWGPVGPRVRVLEGKRGELSLVGRVVQEAGSLTGSREK